MNHPSLGVKHSFWLPFVIHFSGSYKTSLEIGQLLNPTEKMAIWAISAVEFTLHRRLIHHTIRICAQISSNSTNDY